MSVIGSKGGEETWGRVRGAERHVAELTPGFAWWVVDKLNDRMT